VNDFKIGQPAAVVEIRVPASAYAELTDEERMFTVDGDRYIVTADPDVSNVEYVVTWTVDITADSPEAAARKALAMQRDPDSIATVFTVLSETGDSETIDLTETDNS
jgi:hypothetical protein